MHVYERLGIEPIINATGAVTRLGGAPMSGEVIEALAGAARCAVPVEQLQGVASQRIAEATGTEAGLVTAGASAALMLGSAAMLAGLDPSRMELLPLVRDFPHEIVVARAHRNGYDHAVRASGARLVEVGYDEVGAGAGVRRTEAWEYAAAFGPLTAGVLYVLGDHTSPALDHVVEVAHRHARPVLVDAAGELPPRDNLKAISATGADLVAFSGGKAIRGPQSTGILCGRRDLVASALLQMVDMDEHFELWDPPVHLIDKSRLSGIPRQGIGRALKVANEEIVALLTALDLFLSDDHAGAARDAEECLHIVASELRNVPACCALLPPARTECLPMLEVTVEVTESARAALEICRRLRRGKPPIYVGHAALAQGKLLVHPLCLNATTARQVGQRLREELQCISSASTCS
jgi:L-seryl-tRNA(Ser) seleniumtransferase